MLIRTKEDWERLVVIPFKNGNSATKEDWERLNQTLARLGRNSLQKRKQCNYGKGKEKVMAGSRRGRNSLQKRKQCN